MLPARGRLERLGGCNERVNALDRCTLLFEDEVGLGVPNGSSLGRLPFEQSTRAVAEWYSGCTVSPVISTKARDTSHLPSAFQDAGAREDTQNKPSDA